MEAILAPEPLGSLPSPAAEEEDSSFSDVDDVEIPAASPNHRSLV